MIRPARLALIALLLASAGFTHGQTTAAPTTAAVPGVQATEITSESAEMWSAGEETRAIFSGNVVVSGTNIRMTCDRLEITATNIGEKSDTMPMLERFKFLLASGKVQIVQGDREATCGRAEVYPREDKIVLKENPMVTDHANESKVIGDELWLFRGERRVQGINPRVILPPIKDLGFDKNQPPPTASDSSAPDSPPTLDSANQPK